ncbi:unnamed protein product [Thelazia callipaeda]|uniref:C2 domain-containing protein n=1 Tax=Thelazia callipaeda TaxID=103827 RepID=A0A0N5CL83_THECL|nr:unnamed protein product [Thelazia callipaeda]
MFHANRAFDYILVRESTGTQSARSSDDSDGPIAIKTHLHCHYPANIKKILLTRKYHDTNVYSDIGIRVIGGKKLPNGELAAFISAINRGKARETLGEVKEGDRVLEWNGVLLTGKTFEEVEQVIAASRGEIEIIIASNSVNDLQVTSSCLGRTKGTEKCKIRRGQKYDELCNHSQNSEAPPVPAHRYTNGRLFSSSDAYSASKSVSNNKAVSLAPFSYVSSTQQPGTSGFLNLMLSYSRSTSTLFVTVLSARNLAYRQYCDTISYPNPFVKVYLLPGRKVANKRRTKFVPNTSNPVWDQTLEYSLQFDELFNHYLEFTVWDYHKFNDNNSLGQLIISLSDPQVLYGTPRWYPLYTTHNNLVPNFLSSQFQPTIDSTEECIVPHYNPAFLDIGYPAIC